MQEKSSIYDMKRQKYIHKLFNILLIFVLFSGYNAGITKEWEMDDRKNLIKNNNVPVYSYKVIKRYPHDTDAFTQGLILQNGYLYEGTGLRGKSSLKKIQLETGKVLKQHQLDQDFFGEGITILGDLIYQLTYTSNIGFIYNLESFAVNRTFKYSSQGWGLTTDGQHLIMSNGTAFLSFHDPDTFRMIRKLLVKDTENEVGYLNELEYIDNKIYANIWQTEVIAIISPDSGDITAWIDLSGINPDPVKYPYPMNGIAYNGKTGRLIITGKCWPELYEIELQPIEHGRKLFLR